MHPNADKPTVAVPNKVRLHALDHLVMIRAHLHSISHATTFHSRESPSGPWLVLAARKVQLDIRFAVEEMMLLSVAAHEHAGEIISRTIRKSYQAGIIAKELARMNPHYFPVAISIVEADEPGVDGQFLIREGNHLTADLAVEYWNKAGGLLHANSRGLSLTAAKVCMDDARTFLDLTVSLLEKFEVDVSGKGMWIGGQLNFGKSEGPELFSAMDSN